ncbi:MAG TPA: hypothetical protein VFC16_03270 [Nakamurella sp.]|nr:hypothetical protein [Nakamurella sp.]
MRGGQHRYKGSGRGARAYVEADHHRADDYYLAEGAGIAEVVRVDRDGAEGDRLSLSGRSQDYAAPGGGPGLVSA